MRPATITTTARWAVLGLCAAQFVLILDVVIINVALPSIRADLVIPDSRLQLVGIAYTVTFGSLLIVFGRAGDILGRRRVLLTGLIVFVAASVAAGAAQQDWQLFAARAAQGIGAAMVSANALASIAARFDEGPTRNWALGLWAAVGSAGAIAGQLIGGAITEFFGWRWIFFINVPIGVLVMVVLVRTLQDSRADQRPRLDVAGSLLLAGALACAVLGLAHAAEGGQAVVVAGLLAGSAALAVCFIAVERRRPEPVLQFALLRLPGVRIANVTLFLNAGGLGGALFFTTLYLQVVLGYSPLAVAAVFAPVTVLILVLSPRAASLTSRFGVRPLLATGLGLLAVGMLLLARAPVDGGLLDVLPAMLLFAVGSSMSYAPTFIAASAGVPTADQGTASGLINSMQELGAAVCIALLAFAASVATAGPTSGASIEQLTNGYRVGFLCAAGLLAVAVAVAVFTPRSLGRSAATSMSVE